MQADFSVQIFGNTRLLRLVPDVQRVPSTGHWINRSPMDTSMGFGSNHPVHNDLFAGCQYLAFEASAVKSTSSAIYLIS